MKKWILTTEIETDDTFTKKEIRRQIDRYVNRGDGMHVEINKSKIELTKSIPDIE